MKKLMLALLLLFTSQSLRAQTPSEETVAPLFEAFKKERDTAAKAAPEALAVADKLAALAAESRKAESYLVASRLIRDARWSLPTAPQDLPDGARILGYQRLRSSDRVNSVHYNADGTQLVTAAADRSVRVWDLANGREVIVYRGHTPANTSIDIKKGVANIPLRVTEAVFHPDGKRVASAGGKQIHLWDLSNAKTLKTITGPTMLIKSIAFNGDGTRLVSGGDDMIVRVYDVENGKEVFTSAPHSSRIEAVAYQPKGKLVAAVDVDGFLSVYDPTGTNKTPVMKVQVTDGGTQPAYAVRFTPDGTRLLTGGADKVPRLTAAPAADGTVPPTPAATATKLPAHTDDVLAVAVTADGRFTVTGGKDKTVRVSDAAGQLVRQFGGHTGAVSAVAVRPDGRQIAAAADDGTVKVWDLDPVDEHKTMSEAKEPIWAAAVAADGTKLAIAGADKIIRVYTPAGKLEKTLEGSTAAVTSLVFLPDGKLLSAGGDKLIRVWDVANGKVIADWPGHKAAILALATKADGKLVVSGSADKSVTGWNPETGKALWTWTARSVVAALAVHSGGAIAVGTADGGLTILRVDGDKPSVAAFTNAHVSGVSSLVFSPDGKRLASVGGDGRPKLWTLDAKGTPVADSTFNTETAKVITGTTALSAVGFSADGTRLATGGADRVVRIWDTADGKELRMLRGASDWVTALAFLSDSRLLTAGADNVGRIFDLPRRETMPDSGHANKARGVAISPDGTQAVSVGEDKLVRIWNLKTGVETSTVRAATERLLSITYTRPGEIAFGGADRRLRLWTLAPPKDMAITPVGEVYSLMPGNGGGKLGVWSRSNDVDLYAVYNTAEPKKETNPANPFRAGDNPFRLTAITSITEKGRKVSAAAFTADLSLVVSGDEAGSVLIWDLATKATVGKEWKFFDKVAVADVGFSPDRALVIAVNTEGAIQIGDRETRTSKATAKGPTSGIHGLIISPAGNRFAVIGAERELSLFDYDGKEIKSWLLPTAAMSAAFSADGKTLVTANADGSLYVLEMP